MWGKDIIEWKIRSRALFWHFTGILLRGEDLNQKFEMRKCLIWEKCWLLSKVVQLKRIIDGGLGAKLLVNFWKKAILMSLDHILHVFRDCQSKELDF